VYVAGPRRYSNRRNQKNTDGRAEGGSIDTHYVSEKLNIIEMTVNI
jgi:hypothetical protein